MLFPCGKEARWGRHDAQDSIVLSMSNDLLCSSAQHDTHTHSARRGGGSSLLGRYDPVVESLGRSLEGREIECISVGRGELTAWIQHRQHLGETMADEQ